MMEPDLFAGRANKVSTVKMELSIVTEDGRTHMLDVQLATADAQPSITYIGNNLLLDKELNKIIIALGRVNYGLI